MSLRWNFNHQIYQSVLFLVRNFYQSNLPVLFMVRKNSTEAKWSYGGHKVKPSRQNFSSFKSKKQITNKRVYQVCQILQFASKRQNSLVLKLKKWFQRCNSIQNLGQINAYKLKLSMEKPMSNFSDDWVWLCVHHKIILLYKKSPGKFLNLER